MDVLCTDKTGTLTQDRIALERHTDVFGNESRETLQLAWLNSYHQTGLKNLLDRAVVEHMDQNPASRPAKTGRRSMKYPSISTAGACRCCCIPTTTSAVRCWCAKAL